MVGEWRESTVGEIAAPVHNALVGGPFGSNLVSSDYVEAGVPVIRGQNMGGRWVGGEFAYVTEAKANSLEANIARPGDVVFTQRGTLGQVSLVPPMGIDRYLVSQSQMKLTVNRKLADPLFIYYVFSTAEQQDYIRQNAIQTGVPHTNLGILRGTPVLLPPPPEQRAIAHILGTLDDKIELNRRLNETRAGRAGGLSRRGVVYAPPAPPSPPPRDPGLPKPLADLFPDSFEGAELGEIPRGWAIKRLDDLFALDKGLSYKGQHIDRGGTPMVNLGCFLGQGRFDLGVLKGYKGEFEPRHTVRQGDLVLANTDITQRREVIGSPGVIPPTRDGAELIFTHHVFAARFHKGLEPWRDFAFHTLLRAAFRERATGFATGTTVLALPRDAVLAFHFAAPPRPLLEAFSGVAHSFLAREWDSEAECRTLAVLRDTLLPKLISGELRVRAAGFSIGGVTQ